MPLYFYKHYTSQNALLYVSILFKTNSSNIPYNFNLEKACYKAYTSMLQYYLRPTLTNIKYNFNLEKAYHKAYTSMLQY